MLKYMGLPSFKILLTVFSLIFLMNLSVPTVFAHRMFILNGEEARSLQVLYEGDVPARRAVVTLYDEMDNVI